jgi:hypothetical protein
MDCVALNRMTLASSRYRNRWRWKLDQIAIGIQLLDCLLPCADVTASCCCGPVGNALGAESSPGNGPGEAIMLPLLTVSCGFGLFACPRGSGVRNGTFAWNFNGDDENEIGTSIEGMCKPTLVSFGQRN